MTVREKARLDRIARLVEEVEGYTEQIKSLESQTRGVRAKRSRAIVRLNKAGMSERAIGMRIGMKGPSVHEILHAHKRKVAA